MRKYPRTHFAVAKWNIRMGSFAGVTEKAVQKTRRSAPVDLISFPEESAERFITEELKNFESKVLRADEERSSLEYRLFDAVRKQAAAESPRIQEAAAGIAKITFRVRWLNKPFIAGEKMDIVL